MSKLGRRDGKLLRRNGKLCRGCCGGGPCDIAEPGECETLILDETADPFPEFSVSSDMGFTLVYKQNVDHEVVNNWRREREFLSGGDPEITVDNQTARVRFFNNGEWRVTLIRSQFPIPLSDGSNIPVDSLVVCEEESPLLTFQDQLGRSGGYSQFYSIDGLEDVRSSAGTIIPGSSGTLTDGRPVRWYGADLLQSFVWGGANPISIVGGICNPSFWVSDIDQAGPARVYRGVYNRTVTNNARFGAGLYEFANTGDGTNFTITADTDTLDMGPDPFNINGTSIPVPRSTSGGNYNGSGSLAINYNWQTLVSSNRFELRAALQGTGQQDYETRGGSAIFRSSQITSDYTESLDMSVSIEVIPLRTCGGVARFF